MIGLDTNIVVRYLTHDDPVQSAAAIRLFHSLSADEPGFLATTVIIELVWVLESAYHFKKDETVQVVDNLLRSKELFVERAEIISQALTVFRTGRADFADCVIERSGHAAECQYTATFDKHAAAGAGMRMIK